MSEAKFAPCPWLAGEPSEHSGSINIYAADGRPVGMVPPGYGYPDREATAQLFAAAPALLTELKRVLVCILLVGECLGDMDAMYRAIADAEGKTADAVRAEMKAPT